MCQAVEGIENLLPVHHRDQRPRNTCREVAEQAGPRHLNSSQLEGGGLTGLQRHLAAPLMLGDGREIQHIQKCRYRSRRTWREFWLAFLPGGHLESNRRGRWAGQRIRHHIFFSGDVTDVSCVFSQVA
jgi:hypothetical protein